MNKQIQKEWFVFVVGRIGFDPFSTWKLVKLRDNTVWFRLFLGIYWRTKP